MTVLEFRRRRRGGAGRKGMGMHGTIGNDLGFAGSGTGIGRSGQNRAGVLDADMAARAEALARRVREHREACALNQQEFARESGISRATLSKIEQGHIYPSMQVRRKLAESLGVTPQELWNTRRDNSANKDERSPRQAS